MKKLKQVEIEYLVCVLLHHNMNVSHAAKAAGISRKSYSQRLRKHFGEDYCKNWIPTAVLPKHIVFIPNQTLKNIDFPST